MSHCLSKIMRCGRGSQAMQKKRLALLNLTLACVVLGCISTAEALTRFMLEHERRGKSFSRYYYHKPMGLTCQMPDCAAPRCHMPLHNETLYTADTIAL